MKHLINNKLKEYLNQRIKNPAYRVALATINYNRLLIALNFNANVFAAILEGSTFGIIFLSIRRNRKTRSGEI